MPSLNEVLLGKIDTDLATTKTLVDGVVTAIGLLTLENLVAGDLDTELADLRSASAALAKLKAITAPTPAITQRSTQAKNPAFPDRPRANVTENSVRQVNGGIANEPTGTELHGWRG